MRTTAVQTSSTEASPARSRSFVGTRFHSRRSRSETEARTVTAGPGGTCAGASSIRSGPSTAVHTWPGVGRLEVDRVRTAHLPVPRPLPRNPPTVPRSRRRPRPGRWRRSCLRGCRRRRGGWRFLGIGGVPRTPGDWRRQERPALDAGIRLGEHGHEGFVALSKPADQVSILRRRPDGCCLPGLVQGAVRSSRTWAAAQRWIDPCGEGGP